ncbi:MAG: NfeD family protein [Clostridia bacterium]|nr:NfeD family protein [Clostridia bacterium]
MIWLWIWIAVLVTAITVEALTSDLFAIWFFPAALVSMILSLCGVAAWIQIICFFIIGVALVIATRPLCKKFLQGKEVKTNAEALVGKICMVTEEICNIKEEGEVKISGLCWSARSLDEERTIAVGEQVEIVKIQGVKLIVK